MFTGLVEQCGTIERITSGQLVIMPDRPWSDLMIGESIAVNGCCLTAERFSRSGAVEFHTLAETLRRTNIPQLGAGGRVNLERAMTSGGRLGGHIVQGHVDAAVELLALQRQSDGDVELKLALPEALQPEVVVKGSIAIDGVSLTVTAVGQKFVAVRLIPQTLKDTALTTRRPGELINVETDIIGKYLRRQLSLITAPKDAKVPSWNALHEAGLL